MKEEELLEDISVTDKSKHFLNKLPRQSLRVFAYFAVMMMIYMIGKK